MPSITISPRLYKGAQKRVDQAKAQHRRDMLLNVFEDVLKDAVRLPNGHYQLDRKASDGSTLNFGNTSLSTVKGMLQRNADNLNVQS